MHCPSCRHDNRLGAKFCEECATPLRLACPSCGSELRPTAKFCDECGTPIAGAAPARPAPAASARKVVTVVFADLAGSTALHERVDPESARRLMESYYDTVRDAVERHGGTVVKLLGDGVMAAFGVPHVAEDDAIRAVRAGVAMQEAFRALVTGRAALLGDVGLRVAVNTGEVVVSGANDDVVGDPVNVAARLQQEARDGDVVLGEATRRLVDALVTLEPLGSFALRGRAEAVKAHRVVSLEPPSTATTAVFVGRDEELRRIGAVWDAALRAPATRLAVLVGSPGLGKSRLIGEFARRTGEAATVVAARCDAAGGATFAPLADALRDLLGIDGGASAGAVRAAIEGALPPDDDAGRIASGITALLTGSPATPEETFYVVRRLLAALAAAKPVVLVIDDLQWAEPLLLDLVEHLVQWGAGVPLLVLIGARPELRDVRSALVVPGGLVSDVVTLAGLDAGAAMRLAANAIGAADLPAAVAAKVLATSEGNPLFIGELVRMLVEEGALTREGERWTTGTALATLEMPPTIHALLAARIERLGPEERTVLERAAVVGRHFSRSAVAALLPGAGADLDARLEALGRSELIERDSGWLLGDPVLRFHHVLIRDAAYRRLLKETRAELHERLADWIEGRAGDAPEHDETIGRHLEQAHQLRGELGTLGQDGKRLGERASVRLASAGRRALGRDDVPLAAGLLGRALARLEADDPARAELALDWCDALLAAGNVGQASTAIDELSRFAAESPRLRAWQTCFTGQLTVLAAPEALRTTADEVAVAATTLAKLDDAAGEATGHYVHALALARLGQVGGCEAALDRALAAARRAGDRRRANTVLAIAPLAALWGPSPVTRASGRCLDVVRVLRITQGAPAVEAVALSCQGVLEALRGRTDAAKRMIASAREMVEELGISQRLFEADAFAGLVALLEGDGAAAEQSLRGAYEGFRDLGLGIDAARAAALLARALLAQDRAAEAEALSHESEALAGDDLKAAIAWRGVRAEALARRGEAAAAVDHATRAVELAAATDALLDHADARLALAVALRAAGREPEAAAEARHASELRSQKGASRLGEGARGDHEVARPVGTLAEPHPSPAGRRRVTGNAATAWQERNDAAFAARDAEAVFTGFADDFEEVDHTTGSTWGRDGAAASAQHLMHARDARYHQEPLATLGDSLALMRRTLWAGGVARGAYDVGEYEHDTIRLTEVDQRGLICRSEVFATDALGEAVARLYQRHAAQLPEGPGRERARTTARLVTAMLTSSREHRLEDVMTPDVQAVDHRMVGSGSGGGFEVWARWSSASAELVGSSTYRVDDVLALGTEGLLRRTTESGTVRASGGTFANTSLLLSIFGPDGRQTRFEMFDVGHEAEALARFDELTRPPSRRVRPNRASAMGERVVATVPSRDLAAFEATVADELVYVHHPTGVSFGKREQLAVWRSAFRAEHFAYRYEPLATLGESLVLGREWASVTGLEERGLDAFGPSEIHDVFVAEEDGQGRMRRMEIFAADHLGDAVVRLYECHAELVGEGPEHTRAAAAARAIGAVLAPPELERWVAAFDPAVEFLDHRTLGTWSGRGPDAMRHHLNALWELADDVSFGVADVLELRPDVLLVRRLHVGTAREGGGRYERSFLLLGVLGADGLIVRCEFFDEEREAEALGRLEALTSTASSPEQPGRRLRPNAATRCIERFGTAVATRDADALGALLADSLEVVHHPTGVNYERRGLLAMARSAMRADHLECRMEPLASLGDALALERHVVVVEGLSEAHLEGFGRAEFETLGLFRVDDGGRAHRVELFAADQLQRAVGRLYEWFAESLGDGSARAERVADTIPAVLQLVDEDRFAAALAPDVDCVDHRLLGTWTTRGAEALRRQAHGLHEVATDVSLRTDDVLALEPSAILVRQTNVGTARAGGGAYERPFLLLAVAGDDGLVERVEVFDVERAAEALGRFDALVGHDVVPRGAADTLAAFANAATRLNERFVRAWLARDLDAVVALHAPTCAFDDRRALLRHEFDITDETRAGYRVLFDVPNSRWRVTPIATRGERLALSRVVFEGDAPGGGELAIDYLAIDEVGDDGRFGAVVLFGPDDADAAWAELDRRDALGAPAWLGSSAAPLRDAVVARDWDAIPPMLAPSFVQYDHRPLALLGTVRGVDAFVASLRTLVELAPDAVPRIDHSRARTRGWLFQVRWEGTREGGRFELPFIGVHEMGDRGTVVRADLYDPEQVDEAFARFAELGTDAPAPEPFTNAAARAWEVGAALWTQRDPAPVARHHARLRRYRDHRRQVLLDLDRDQFLEFARPMLDMAVRASNILLATRGDRLALVHPVQEVAGDTVGPSTIESLVLVEIDETGAIVAYDRWDLADLDAARAKLDERWEALEGPSDPGVRLHLRYQRMDARRDWEGAAAMMAPDFRVVDHRLLGWGETLTDAPAFVRMKQALVELAPDARNRVDHVRTAPGVQWAQAALVGTRDGGAFEIPYVSLSSWDEAGRARRLDVYSIEQLGQSRARFDEARRTAAPRPTPGAVRPNAACAALDRWQATYDAGFETDDWDPMRALCAPECVFEDRRPFNLLSGDAELMVVSARERALSGARPARLLVGTAGERVAVERMLWRGGPPDGPFEIEYHLVSEVDEAGRVAAALLMPDARAAQREAWKRWAAIDPSVGAFLEALSETFDAWNDQDVDRLSASLAEGLVTDDRRRTGTGRSNDREEYLRSVVALWALAPDNRLDLGWEWLAIAPHLGLCRARRVGTIPDGGEFESDFLVLGVEANGKMARLEVFEADDAEAALSRFEALCARAPRVPPSTATHS